MLSRTLLFSFFLLPTFILTSSNEIKPVNNCVTQAEKTLATALKNKDPKAIVMAGNIEKIKITNLTVVTEYTYIF